MLWRNPRPLSRRPPPPLDLSGNSVGRRISEIDHGPCGKPESLYQMEQRGPAPLRNGNVIAAGRGRGGRPSGHGSGRPPRRWDELRLLLCLGLDVLLFCAGRFLTTLSFAHTSPASMCDE